MASRGIKVGAKVAVSGRSARIQMVTDFDNVLVRWDDTQLIESVERTRIDLEPKSAYLIHRRETATSEQLEEAERWLKACLPIITADRPTMEMYAEAARELGKHPTTIRRAIERYESTDRTALALLRPPGHGGRGGVRLDEEVDAILQDVIKTYYLTRKEHSVRKTYTELKLRCRNAGLGDRTPHYNTLLKRIGRIEVRERVRLRKGAHVLRDHMEPIKGRFPSADRPLAVVQIDHHYCDVQIVDEIHRLSIGRPWLTLAIDVYTRMIVGLYLSLDFPSANSVGMCLINAFLPKDDYLRRIGVEAKWPVWGLCRVLHSDNGKDFRGAMLREACRLRGIETQFRPVRDPHFGGHIERMCGNVAEWLKGVEGATYSNPRERGEGNRGGTPTMTLRELERWLVNQITGVYHLQEHSSIGVPPLTKWHSHFFGPKGQQEELPEIVVGSRSLRLDFMPMMKRTVQRYGLVIHNVHYMAEPLKHLIPEPGKRAEKFMIRYDPANMSPVWLYDPGQKRYIEVGFRDVRHTNMSKWELHAAIKKLRTEKKPIDENGIFETIGRMRKIESEAATKSKQARRKLARRKAHADLPRPALANPTMPQIVSTPTPTPAEPIAETSVTRVRVKNPFPERPGRD